MGCWPSEQSCRRTPTGWLASHPWKGCCSQAGWLGHPGLQPQHWQAGCWAPQEQKRRPGGSAWSGAPPQSMVGAECTGRLGRAGLDTSPAQQRTVSAHQPGGRDRTTARQTTKGTRIRCDLLWWHENKTTGPKWNWILFTDIEEQVYHKNFLNDSYGVAVAEGAWNGMKEKSENSQQSFGQQNSTNYRKCISIPASMYFYYIPLRSQKTSQSLIY